MKDRRRSTYICSKKPFQLNKGILMPLNVSIYHYVNLSVAIIQIKPSHSWHLFGKIQVISTFTPAERFLFNTNVYFYLLKRNIVFVTLSQINATHEPQNKKICTYLGYLFNIALGWKQILFVDGKHHVQLFAEQAWDAAPQLKTFY